jgi:solute carrier family 35 (probable UDP-sugar transporter), member A4
MLNINNIPFLILLLFQSISYGSYTILVHLCEKNGKIPFNATSLNLVIEILKLSFSIICLGIVYMRNNTSTNNKYNLDLTKTKPNFSFSFKTSLYFSLPSILYFINNNLAVYMQLYMDPMSYQILSNLKIVSTAVLYFLIIGLYLFFFFFLNLC